MIIIFKNNKIYDENYFKFRQLLKKWENHNSQISKEELHALKQFLLDKVLEIDNFIKSSQRKEKNYETYNFDRIIFDDFNLKIDTEYNDWSQICTSCVEKYKINTSLLDDSEIGICGVQGCQNKASYYIDFLTKKVGIKSK